MHLNDILMRPGVLHPPPGWTTLPASVQDDVTNTARSQAFLEVCQRLDQFDPQVGSFIGWVQDRFKWRFHDEAEKYCQRQQRQQQVIGETKQDESRYHDEPEPSAIDALRDHLIADPTGEFRETHVRDRPDLTFQTIALRRLDGQGWEEMATELGATRHSTLSGFYDKWCKRFLPRLRQHFAQEGWDVPSGEDDS